jgi:hypothetical protein
LLHQERLGFSVHTTVGAIETSALRQPKVAYAEFVHPHEVKGGIRFFTDQQERIYAVAKLLMISFWPLGVTLLVILGRFEENWREGKQRDLLDPIATETSRRIWEGFALPTTGTSDDESARAPFWHL